MAILLVGDNTAYASTSSAVANTAYWYGTGHVAVASGTVTAGKLRMGTAWGATGVKILVYNSSRALIGTSNAGTPASGWVTCTFTSGPSITSGQTYYLAFVFNAGTPDLYMGGGTDWLSLKDASSYASPDVTLAAGSGFEAYNKFPIYVEGDAAGGGNPWYAYAQQQ